MKTEELQLMKKAVQFIGDFIAIKPACELIGLDYISQYKSVKNDQILGQLLSLETTTGADGKQYQMVSLPKNGFLMWIYRLQSGRILDDMARENLIKIQKVIHEYLYKGEITAKQLERHIIRTNNILQEQNNLRVEISANGRRLKELNRELKKQLATDPYQNELPFDEPPSLDYKPV